MANYSPDQIRNVALVGQSGVGKTTLAEALLHRAGAVARQGSIGDGTTALDREPDAIERQSSVALGLASFDWRASDGNTYRINLLDTPGHPDFEADTAAALSVADLAVIVVSASDGVEVGTTLAWERCEELGLPCFVFVTREDRPRANLEHVLDGLSASFGSGFVPLELPLGEEEAFHGVADVITEEAHEYDADGAHHVEAVPAEMAEREHEVHDQVVEEIVTGDDAQLERYLEGEQLTSQELERTLASEVLARTEFPVLVGSGTKGIGVDRLADYICEVGPSPADRPVTVRAGEERIDLTADPSTPPLLNVFKTISDQYVGRISLFKVITGTLRADATLVDHATGTQERVHAPFTLCGSEHAPVGQLVAGDLGAVAKLTAASTGSTLGPPDQPVVVPAPRVPAAHVSVVLVPRAQTDEDRLPEALQKLVQEDPSLVVEHDELSRGTILRCVGDTQLAVTLSRLARRYEVHVDTDEVRVPYRRTITQAAEAEGRVKKQSGGHGQFAVVNLRVQPRERGSGIEFVDSVVGGAIPKQYVQAAEHGVTDALERGGAVSIPVVDIHVECYDGKTHSVDSSDMAFRTAAAHGVLQAVDAAGPVVLEPIVRVEVTVPSESQGDVLGDLGARRGRIVNSVAEGVRQRIEADVPMAELGRYAMDLRSLTGGRGTFTVGEIGYEALPDHLVADVLAQYAS
jgi:elongation factor G